MSKLLDETMSNEVAKSIHSQANHPFMNAYKAALATVGTTYVQGFLVCAGQPYQPIEHSWIELGDRIIDPTLPHLNKNPQELWYFPAQSLTVQKLQKIIEESKEDYPEDDPLPIYGEPPYAYYGDVMLGGEEYLSAHKAALIKCQQINQPHIDKN
jgi:hypothetical protein